MNAFRPSDNLEIRELQETVTQLKMDIKEALNTIKARLAKATGEISGKLSELEAKLQAAVAAQTPLDEESVRLIQEISEAAQKLDDIVADTEVDAASTPAAE